MLWRTKGETVGFCVLERNTPCRVSVFSSQSQFYSFLHALTERRCVDTMPLSAESVLMVDGLDTQSFMASESCPASVSASDEFVERTYMSIYLCVKRKTQFQPHSCHFSTLCL